MDSAPISPVERRRSNQFDGPARSRRSSQYSQKRMSQGTGDVSDLQAPGRGLDNLADELGGDWDEDVDELDESEMDRSHMDGSSILQPAEADKIRDSGIGVGPQPPSATPEKNTTAGSRHSRRLSRQDASVAANEQPATDFPATLKACMADVEGLTKLGPGGSGDGSDQDDAISRALLSLRDLGGQNGIEQGATRLINAHSSLTVHLTSQTRSLQSLTYSLLSPLSPPPDIDLIDELLPLIADSIAMIPQPMLSALNSMAGLADSSQDVIQTLNGLADSLHMSRQVASDATRRLKSSRELVAGIRREDTACDEGMRFIESGNWQNRLASRECASVCKDVVGGFEQVCESWREKLLASAEVGAA